jgi:hypothetical protein
MHNRLLKFLILLGALSYCLPAQLCAQDTYFVQFVFQGTSDFTSVQIDSTLKASNEIYMSRTDFNTHNYLAVCSSTQTADFITAYFTEIGFDVTCLNTGVHGQDLIAPIDPKKCGFQQYDEEEK